MTDSPKRLVRKDSAEPARIRLTGENSSRPGSPGRAQACRHKSCCEPTANEAPEPELASYLAQPGANDAERCPSWSGELDASEGGSCPLSRCGNRGCPTYDISLRKQEGGSNGQRRTGCPSDVHPLAGFAMRRQGMTCQHANKLWHGMRSPISVGKKTDNLPRSLFCAFVFEIGCVLI